MATDLASLRIEIDASGVAKANQELGALSNAASRTQSATQRWRQEMERAEKCVGGMSGGVASLSGELRGCAKQLLGLAVAWKSFTGLRGWVESGFAYNEQLEKANLGIAAVVSSTMNLVDAQGKALSGQEKFNAALEMSEAMAKRLDVASMQSPASYTDLLSTYQRLLAPANQLGLSWEDTLEATIKMSNVLSALGLDMERLGSETEAILTGKNLSQSAVAQRLGLTKEEIDSWGKGEEMMRKFQERLEAFKYAGAAVEDTMEAVREYFNDVVQNAAGDAGAGLWNSMKKSMLDVADAFYAVNEQTQKFEKTEEWESISGVLDKIGSKIGDNLVGATEKAIGAVQSLGKWLGGIDGVEVENALEGVDTAAKAAALGLGALVVARRSASAGLGAMAKEKISFIATTHKAIAAERQEAVEKLASARAELVKFRATQQSALATTNATQMGFARAAMLRQEQALLANVTAAQNAYSAALAKSAGAVVVLNGMKAAASGLLGLFGGPLGLAFTAATVGITYFMTSTSKAEAATKAFGEAQENVRRILGKNTDETGKFIGELDKLERKQLEIAQKSYKTQLGEEVSKMQAALAKLEKDASPLTSISNHAPVIFQDMNDIIPQKFFTDINALLKSLREGKISGDDFKNTILDVSDRLKECGYESSNLYKFLEQLISEARDGAGTWYDNANGLRVMAQAFIEVATNAKLAQQGMLGLKGFDAIMGDIEYDNALLGVKSSSRKKTISTLVQRKAISKEQGIAITSGDMSSLDAKGREQFNALEAAYKEQEKRQNALKSGGGRRGGGGGGASRSLDDGAEKIKKLREEIAVLNGETSRTAASLSGKLQEIDKLGASSKTAAGEVAKLKEEYKAAFQGDMLRKFDKELLQVKGDTGALKALEIEEKMREWGKGFEAAGISAEVAAPKLREMREALENEKAYNDLQAAAGFMNELASMGSAYGASIQMQNDLIAVQAEMYEQKLDPSLRGYIAEWERLKVLQNDKSLWGGLERGLRKFGADYGDISKQVESFTTQMGSTIGNTLSDAFMKGKLSAEDFFSSLISMSAQAASNAFIGEIFGGIGGIVGGFFGGGSFNGLNSNAAAGAANTSGYAGMGMRWSGASAHGNVFSGGSLSRYSGQIVSTPTLFDYDSHISKFANGAGLMGEAGPEAILPLARTAGGDLGVQVAGGDGGWNCRPEVNIMVVNESGQPVEAQSQATPNASGGFDLQIIVAQVEEALVGRAKAGKSRLMQYQEKAYGMNRAGVLARGRGRA